MVQLIPVPLFPYSVHAFFKLELGSFWGGRGVGGRGGRRGGKGNGGGGEKGDWEGGRGGDGDGGGGWVLVEVLCFGYAWMDGFIFLKWGFWVWR